MELSPAVKNILYALAIMVGSVVLLNLTFVVYWLIHLFYNLFSPAVPGESLFALRPITLVVILIILTWLVFRSKIATLFKAIYATVPVAVVLVFIGIGFSEQLSLVYILSTLFSLSVLLYLIATKKSWLYFFSVIFVSLALLIMSLTGVEI